MERRTTKDGMISVDRNHYSVPNDTKNRQLQIYRTATELRILDENALLAIHPLLLGKNQRQVIPGYRVPDAVVVPMTRHPVKSVTIERAGDSVPQRGFDVYEVNGATLAKEGQT